MSRDEEVTMSTDVKVADRPVSQAGEVLQPEDEERPLMIGPLYVGTKAEQKARMEAQLRLLDEWMSEDPEYDLETLPWLMGALDEDRPGQRKLFPELTDG